LKTIGHGQRGQMIFVCSVGVPILQGWIIILLLFQYQLGEIPLSLLSELFGWIEHIPKCDPLDYFSKEGNILWALMGEAHIQVGKGYAQW